MKLPPILSVDASKKDEVVLDIGVTADLEAFQGHFPGYPILPGVVQIDWAVRFAALHLAISEQAACDFQVKFRNTIRPTDPLALTLKFDRSKNRLSFTYKSGDTVMSSGQMRLGLKA